MSAGLENSKDARNGGAQTDLIVGTTAQPKCVSFYFVLVLGSLAGITVVLSFHIFPIKIFLYNSCLCYQFLLATISVTLRGQFFN